MKVKGIEGAKEERSFKKRNAFDISNEIKLVI